jgi:hypothetical protein
LHDAKLNEPEIEADSIESNDLHIDVLRRIKDHLIATAYLTSKDAEETPRNK